ncbi:MAG: HAMP domain-containing sensor histidine kinase [Pseudomonadales bacterium]|nr:HAMP domain-containing sensor histidine kinase [Pseudomonadales bacterium]
MVFVFIVFSYFIAYESSQDSQSLGFIAAMLLGLFWAAFAAPFQNFLLTTANRKFVRGWYDTENLISEISSQITVEKSRQEIFKIIRNILDEGFQLERSRIIVAERSADGKLLHYISMDKSGKLKQMPSQSDQIVSEYFKTKSLPEFLEDVDAGVKNYLSGQGYKLSRQCALIPFHSPDYLEGIIILGERSNQVPYAGRDIKFFVRLVNYMSAILYRLTPLEKLEKQYFDNKQRLHEAEIQLIRAQKIEAIVHATRQCHHEIRTPLNIIRLGIGRIKGMDDLEAYRNIASEEINRALEIVEETLTITDVSKATIDRYSSVDVNEVLRRCSRLVDETRYTQVLALQDLPRIKGIFSDLQVAVTNLIHNALDAMPTGGMLEIRSSLSAGNIIIEIKDSGVGIAEHLRSRVWEPYFSGQESSVGNSTAGRGWGLTIVNRIVTEHRGTVNFVSQVNEGTTFTISLPVD